MNRVAIPGCVLIAALVIGIARSETQNPQTSVSAASSQIIPPTAGYRFPDGQTYNYTVEWHLFTAGTARVKMEAASNLRQVSASADSSGVANLLYGVHDRFQAWFDPQTFCSLRVAKHTEEGFRKRDTAITFEYSRRKTVLDEKNLKSGETKHEENDIPGCVTDVISGFYYLASLPLQPGNTYIFPMSDGGKTVDVEAQVETREQVKVPAGTFQTVRVQAEAISGPLKGKGRIWVWFSDDANHLPVQMRSKLGWGTLLFRLQK